MIELGIGIFFAASFVTSYLFIARLSKPDRNGRAMWRSLITPTPLDAVKAIGAKSTGDFLTTPELSEHHSQMKTEKIHGESGKRICVDRVRGIS